MSSHVRCNLIIDYGICCCEKPMLWHYPKESKVEDFLDETMSRKISRSGKSLGMTLWGVCAIFLGSLASSLFISFSGTTFPGNAGIDRWTK